jgi:hypothetical protein
MRVGPVTFLFAVASGWAAVRAVMLWPEAEVPEAPRRIVWKAPLEPHSSASLAATGDARRFTVLHPSWRRTSVFPEAFVEESTPPVLLAGAAHSAPASAASPRAPTVPIFPPQPAARPKLDRSRLSVSAWAIVRGKAGPGLASAGQLGGSQAGVRAGYAFAPDLSAALRISGPLRSRLGKEAAVALDWRPVRRLPVTITIERRVGLDRGGRDAFAAGVFGGGEVSLPLDLRLDGYGQAGIVGLSRRDLYADGAVRLERPLIESGRFRLAAGAGAWGGAQPGASRLDIGPQLVAHVPVGRGALRIGAEWRERVAGRARPGSGPALSIGADF